jgi:hypothetical protein
MSGLIIVLLLGVAPLAGAQDMSSDLGAWTVALGTTPFAEGVGLADVTGSAFIQPGDGYVQITLQPNGAALPAGSVLEGWVVDAGRNGGPGETNASAADQAFGAPFGNLAFDVLVSAAPYALSTGVLTPDDAGNWTLTFQVPHYNFSPYDAVVITLEADGNTGNWDPRPGTPVFAGGLAEAQPAEAMALDMMMSDDMMGNMEAIEISLSPTPLATNAGLENISGVATLYSDGDSTITFTINLNGAQLPEGSVLEGWVVDAGLFGGPGTANAYTGDETFGIPFGDASFNAAVEASPYALSTGVAAVDETGNLSATFHIPAYNFQPYDAFVVTLESDGNSLDGFDPRPGTPVLAGEIGGM